MTQKALLVSNKLKLNMRMFSWDSNFENFVFRKETFKP